MFDSTIKVLEMKNMPIPQTIHAIATVAVTAAKSVTAFRVLTMAVNLS